MLFCLTEASMESIKGPEANPRVKPFTVSVSDLLLGAKNDAPKSKYTLAPG